MCICLWIGYQKKRSDSHVNGQLARTRTRSGLIKEVTGARRDIFMYHDDTSLSSPSKRRGGVGRWAVMPDLFRERQVGGCLIDI